MRTYSLLRVWNSRSMRGHGKWGIPGAAQRQAKGDAASIGRSIPLDLAQGDSVRRELRGVGYEHMAKERGTDNVGEIRKTPLTIHRRIAVGVSPNIGPVPFCESKIFEAAETSWQYPVENPVRINRLPARIIPAGIGNISMKSVMFRSLF